MKQFITTLDGLDKLIKLILALPGIDIVWGIYRVFCALEENDVVALIIAVVMLFIPIVWVVDLAFIFLYGNVWRYKI